MSYYGFNIVHGRNKRYPDSFLIEYKTSDGAAYGCSGSNFFTWKKGEDETLQTPEEFIPSLIIGWHKNYRGRVTLTSRVSRISWQNEYLCPNNHPGYKVTALTIEELEALKKRLPKLEGIEFIVEPPKTI
jgi:hypothetical protein